MAMSKKHYIDMAYSLREYADDELIEKSDLVLLMCEFFEDDNPKFDRKTFKKACRYIGKVSQEKRIAQAVKRGSKA